MSRNLSLEEFKILERRIHDEYPDITEYDFKRRVFEFMIYTLEPEHSEQPEEIEDDEEGYTTDKDYPDQ